MIRKQLLWFMLACFLLTACSVDLSKPNGEQEDDTLVDYVLKTPSQFSGEGQYFHEVKNVSVDKESPYKYVYSGEVKSDAVDRTSSKSLFTVSGYVDSEKWVETYDDSNLNESELKTVVLLKLPLELGTRWTFETEDKMGVRHKVEAKITDWDASSGRVTAEYESNQGLKEKRTFEKDKGTVKFTRFMTVVDTQLITGYALIRSEKQSLSSYDELTSLKVDPKISTLIRTFTETLLEGDRESLLPLLSKEAPALEKVSANQEKTETWSFQGLKIYDLIEKESELTVLVVEKYSQSDKVYYNTVQYTLVYENDALLLYDFKPIEKTE